MPRIPQYTQQQSLPTSGSGVRVEPSEMLAEQAGMKRAGAALTDLGETLAIRGHQIQADIDEKRTLDEFAGFDSEARQYVLKQRQVIGKNAIRTNEDGTFALNTEAEKWHAEKVEEYAGRLENENQKRAFRKLATSQVDANLNHVASHISTEYGSYNREVRATWIQNTMDAIQLSGGDPAAIDQAVAKYQAAIKALYPGQDVSEMMQRDMTRFEHAALAKRKEWEVTAVLVDLKGRYEGNTEAAMEEASGAEFLAKHGEPVQRQVLSALNNDLRIQDEIYQKTYRKTADDFSTRLTAGKLTESAIDGSDLRPDDKERWKGHLRARQAYDRTEARARRAEKREADRDQREKLKDAQDRVMTATLNAIRSEQITDEADIDRIVAGAGLDHDKMKELKTAFDNQAGAKGQVNYYTMATEQLDKHFGWDVKKDRSEDETKRRNQYLKTLDHYMRQAKLRTNDPGVLELMDKLLEKRAERTQPWNLPQWGVPTRLEEIVESNTFIAAEDLGFKLPKKTTRK